jgi:hypothetical protein
MARELSKNFQCVKFVSSAVLSGVGKEISHQHQLGLCVFRTQASAGRLGSSACREQRGRLRALTRTGLKSIFCFG